MTDDRLDPDVLKRDARALLKRCVTDADMEQLIIRLLRDVRGCADREEAIRTGYSRSYEMQEDLHASEVEGLREHLVAAIQREARAGTSAAPRGQHVTYEGGLRRAARIVAGGLWSMREVTRG